MAIMILDNEAVIDFQELNKRLVHENAALRYSNLKLVSKARKLRSSADKFKRWSEGLRMLNLSKSKKLQFQESSALRSSFQHRDFLMKAPAGICLLTGPDLIIELVNPVFQNLFPGIDMLGKPLIEAMPDLIDKPLWLLLQQIYKTGEPYEGKEMMIPKFNENCGTGKNRFFNFKYSARLDEAGTVDGVMAFTFEVTDLVLNKRRIEENELHSGRILDAIHQIAFTMNLGGELTFVNQRWYEYTGLDYEKEKDSVWELTMHPEEMEEMSVKWTAILEGKKGGEFEFRKKRKDGQFLWHLCSMEPILDLDGNVLSWIGTSTDIDELKRLQNQKDDFINIASHELKTPLTSLKVALQLLEERNAGLTADKMASLVNRATKSLDKVVSLVDDLLNVGQFNQGKLSLNKTWFCITELIMDYCNVLRISSGYTISFSGDLFLRVFADSKRIEQVMVNIINNAIKYAPESKLVQINIEDGFREVKISIKDFGPGIKEELVHRLFERYYRVEQNGYKNTGLGLGLYISSEIVKMHGGEINVNTTLGKGCVFWFTLPTN